MSIIEKTKKNNPETFYEPIDLSIWEELSFGYQRDITHAIMGYRLTYLDVKSCPVFPQVNETERQLNLADYVIIQGEPGCGKSISLYQVAYRFYENGWKIYLLKQGFDEEQIVLPNNTEKSVYLIDDAQIYSESLISQVISQAQSNRKVLLAKTISDSIDYDSVILTNKDAVNVLYKEYLNRKAEIYSIVKKCDKTIGANFFDTPIEQRLEAAREANSPWQFSYTLRGGWNSMRENYKSISEYNNCDLLTALVAVFQILQLDKPVDFDLLCRRTSLKDSRYHWTSDDLSYLFKRRIIASEKDVRIVHLESANVITALFFNEERNEKQSLVLQLIEDSYLNGEISPLGIVWLCNGPGRYINSYWRSEDLFITDHIIDDFPARLKLLGNSEEVRNLMYLLEKLLLSNKKEAGIKFISSHARQLIELMNKADSISAWGFGVLLNSIYNSDNKLHNRFVQQVAWGSLIERMVSEQKPDYYSWGKLFNRGLSLFGRKQDCAYSTEMYNCLNLLVSRATVINIESITSFICSVSFLIPNQLNELMMRLMPVYKQLFMRNTDRVLHIIDFDFMCRICGVDLWGNRKVPEQQRTIAIEFINTISAKALANVISDSSLHEWLSIRNVLYFIYCFDVETYNAVIKNIDLEKLSEAVKDSWNKSYEISLIIEYLATADIVIAKEFMLMNSDQITVLFPIMISVNPSMAIKMAKETGARLDVFAEHNWEDTYAAFNALFKSDRQFAINYLRNNIDVFAVAYSNVRALDFRDRFALDLLKEIEKVDNDSYYKIIERADKDRIDKNWDLCGGIPPRKKQWIQKRKMEFYKIMGLTN